MDWLPIINALIPPLLAAVPGIIIALMAKKTAKESVKTAEVHAKVAGEELKEIKHNTNSFNAELVKRIVVLEGIVQTLIEQRDKKKETP